MEQITKEYTDGYRDGRLNTLEEIYKLTQSNNRVISQKKEIFGSNSDEIEKSLEEELKMLRERGIPKIPYIHNEFIICPTCGEQVGEWTNEDGDEVYNVFHRFCPECGQALQDSPDIEV